MTRNVLCGLLELAGELEDSVQLDRIHFMPREGLIVSANADSMVWLRQPFLNVIEPFSISRHSCAQSIKLKGEASEPGAIRVSDTHNGGRRRLTVWVAGEEVSELENLAPYPNFRALLAERPDQQSADFDPDQLARLRKAMALIVGRRELPVHLVRRGSAAAFVVCPLPTVVGFIAPWAEARAAERGCPSTLRAFGLDRAAATAPRDSNPADRPIPVATRPAAGLEHRAAVSAWRRLA
ncbi:MAG: hypothetical protein ACJ8R9_05370 [Steroidobacteraceae bacterium]